jgi:hypothetical protein
MFTLILFILSCLEIVPNGTQEGVVCSIEIWICDVWGWSVDLCGG